MKRWLRTLVTLVLLCPTLVWAAPLAILNASQAGSSGGRNGYVVTVLSAQAVASAATVGSDVLDLSQSAYFGAWYSCTSAGGAPDVTLTWHEAPTVESTDFVSVFTIKANLIVETPQFMSIQPGPMRYARVVVVGNGPNPADTLCTVKVFLQG